MPPSQPRIEEVAGQRLPLGGINGYLGVRGKQGRGKDKFQGVTPKKQHRTGLFDSPLQAAIAFAQLKEDLDLGMLAQRSRKKRASPATLAASRKSEVGTRASATSGRRRAACCPDGGMRLAVTAAGSSCSGAWRRCRVCRCCCVAAAYYLHAWMCWHACLGGARAPWWYPARERTT